MIKIGLLLLVLVPIVAFPQQDPVTYFSLGPGLGFYATPDTDDWNSMVRVSARFRYEMIGGELALNYKSETYNNDVVWVKSWPIQASVVLYPVSWLYVLGGAGYYDLYFDYNQNYVQLAEFENESKQQWAPHVGLGIEKPFSRTSNLVLEARYSRIDYEFRAFPGSDAIDTHSLSIVATMFFKFGVE